ncbi:MAG: 2-C-methyl-D-erythritol 4-phosphate cytidylyltransferase [Natronospirillum sp.]
MMKNIAVILASGSGSRFGAKLPKQFVRLAGKPVIQYTIEAFEAAALIDEIMIVTKEEFVDYVYEIVNAQTFKKVTKVIVGGAERYDSTLSALQAITDEEANVIIHDAVRPFVSENIINRCVEALKKYNAVDVVVDATDTIVRVKEQVIQEIPDRRFLKRGQTPQAFKKTTLQKAYDLFMKDDEKIASDDCGIVLKYLPDEPVVTVQGEEANFKITHQQDIYLADNLIKDGLIGRMSHDTANIESALKGKVIVVIGASSGIGEDIVKLCKNLSAKVYRCSRSINGVDITSEKSLRSTLADIQVKEGRIDYVINTTGLLNRKPLVTMTEQEVVDSYMVNYVGVLNIARASFEFLKQSRGMLINFTSSSYTRGRGNYSIYSSTKAAVVNFTQALAEEWQPHGIKVNVINPERTATPMRTANFGNEPANTLLSSKEVAEFTLSAMSFEHTGQVFSIKNDI